MKAITTLSIALLLAGCNHDNPARFNLDGVQAISVPEPAPLLLLGFGVAVALIATRRRR